MADFNTAVTKLIVREGGDRVVNKPADSGGVTKFGISKANYPKVNIPALTEELARQLYRADFWNKIHGDDIISQAVAEAVLGAAVNQSPARAARWLQDILGISQDGVIGSATVSAINAADPVALINAFRLHRIQNYIDIVAANRTQEVFLLGWIRRVLGE